MFAMCCILANMRDFVKRHKTHNARRLLISAGGLALLVLITAVMIRAAWGMYGKFAEASNSDELAQNELAQLQVQQTQVAASVDSFTSSRGIEAQVRERYGVVKPGEGQIQIVRDSSTTTVRSIPTQNLFKRAWQALFGWI